jgi:ubiquinone/menaquinone biosynthesis C-methylase UbiE
MSRADRWSEYWVNEGTTGEVFVDKDGNRHPQLDIYWRMQLSGLKTDARIIDLACGAGSVFSHLENQSSFQLFAADLSLEALQLLGSRIPESLNVSCSVSSLPFAEQQFDLVVSQFGIEYAGEDAFVEAAKLIRDQGRLAVLCHYEEGFIDKKNKGHLLGARAAHESSFIPLGRKLAEAIFSQSQDKFHEAHAKFLPAEQKLAEMTQCYQGGVHTHLYLGFRQLVERYQHYKLSDVTHWLSEMQGDLDKNIVRLEAMRDAACSEDKVKDICIRLAQLGLRKIGYSPFNIEGQDLPVAWSITAEKS